MNAYRAVWVLAVVGCVGATCVSATAADKVERARFVKLSEITIGEKEYVAMVVKPVEGDGQTTLLIQRSSADMLAAAKKLRAEQLVAVRFVDEGGHKWLKRFEAVEGERKDGEGDRERTEKREGDRPREAAREGEVKREGDRPREGERERAEKREGDRPREGERERAEKREGERKEGERPAASAEMAEIRELLRRMNARIEALEREVRALRAENARLKGEGRVEGERKEGVRREGEGERREGPRDRE